MSIIAGKSRTLAKRGLTAEYPAIPAVLRDEVATRYTVRGELKDLKVKTS